MTAAIDHLVIGAATLEAGADHVERLIGARPAGGGRHEGAGTHNLLLGLGPGAYLEVIARDPAAPDPALPRLFGLDDPAIRDRITVRPRLLTWVARTTALDPLLARLGPASAGTARRMARGALSWRLAVPPAGAEEGGLLPGLIQWEGEGAASRIPDSGCRLLGLAGEHPAPDALGAALRERGIAALLDVATGPHPRLSARLARADGGTAMLSSD